MGLRYFDSVVVVSAGRFTEMEAIWQEKHLKASPLLYVFDKRAG